MTGGFRYLVSGESDVTRAAEWIKELLQKHGPQMVTITALRDKRSLSQNALFWLWCTDIANFFGWAERGSPDKQRAHDVMLILRWGYREEEAMPGVIRKRLPKTSRFDKGQMGDLLTWVEAWCVERGIPLSYPPCPDYELYKEAQA